LNSFLSAESEYWEFFLPQAVRGLALMFCFMPINDLALGTMHKKDVQNASGLYNLTRNLGGAIGLAVINSLIISKSKIYAQGMKENMSLTSPQVLERVEFFTQSLIGKVDNPELAAMQLLDNVVSREAFIIAINNVFVIIAILFCMGMILIPFSSTPKNTAGSNAH
jgi:DHA2 family multidrug resistance protein